MVFSRTVDCDRIDETDEPSLLWKLPLLLLALVLQQQGHNYSPASHSIIKWQPSLETIQEASEEEEDLPTPYEQRPKAAFATWQTAFVWTAVWYLSFRKQQSLLDVLVMG